MFQEEPGRKQARGWRAVGEGGWGLLAGLIGSLCCIGPSAAILLGLGSSSALFGLQVDQRLALGGGVAVLIVGCTLAARRSRTCAVHPRARWRQLALMLAAGGFAYGLLGVFVPWAAVRQEQASAAPVVAAAPATPVLALHQATLFVEKMDCPPCVAHLRGLLARKPFVARFGVEAGSDQVTVVYDSRQIDASQLLALIPAQYKAALQNDMLLP